MTHPGLKEMVEVVSTLLHKERVFVAEGVPQDGQMGSQHYIHLNLFSAAYSFSFFFFLAGFEWDVYVCSFEEKRANRGVEV